MRLNTGLINACAAVERSRCVLEGIVAAFPCGIASLIAHRSETDRLSLMALGTIIRGGQEARPWRIRIRCGCRHLVVVPGTLGLPRRRCPQSLLDDLDRLRVSHAASFPESRPGARSHIRSTHPFDSWALQASSLQHMYGEDKSCTGLRANLGVLRLEVERVDRRRRVLRLSQIS